MAPSAQPPPSRPWDTARCHRLLRPLAAKLQSLRTVVQTQPSASALLDPHKTETRKDPADAPYVPSKSAEDAPDIRPQRRRKQQTDRGLFGELVGRRAVARTYSSARTTTAGNTSQPNATTTTGSVAQTAHVGFPAPAIDWDAPLHSEAPAPRPKPAPKPTTAENDPRLLLAQLQPYVHESVFNLYVGIFTAFELLITSTQPGKEEEAPTLQELSVRKIAYCIVATSKDEEHDDDAWYEAVENTGVGGSHLRVLVRWHGLEIMREAIVGGLLSPSKKGLGLPGVLIGLCKLYKAHAEAESLLQTLMEQHPLSASQTDPSLVALIAFWKEDRESMLRIMTQNLGSEGTPVSLGNPIVNQLLRLAVGEVESDAASASFVTRAMDAAFGIWGETAAATARQRRKESARRKGSRKSAARETEAPATEPKKPPPLPDSVGRRAEEMALQLITKLFTASFDPKNTRTHEILEHLAHGFVLQDEAARTYAEEAWDTFYPVAAKVLVLTYCLGHGGSDDSSFVAEIVRCMEDIRTSTGRDGLRRIGEFIAGCFESRYSPTGKPLHGKDDMKAFITRLMETATRPPQTPSSALRKPHSTPAKPLQTPLVTRTKVVTFTPNKVEPDAEHQKDRYYLTQLAMSTTAGFSALDCARNNEKWISWASTLEHKIISLKLRTPKKPKKPLAPETPAKPSTTGWRYEEGLGEWVAVGHTPGLSHKPRAVDPPARKQPGFEIIIPAPPRTDWRREYTDFTRRTPLDTPDSTLASIFDRTPSPDTDASTPPCDIYAPTPAKPPASLRRSPRSAARIRRSLDGAARRAPLLASSPTASRAKRTLSSSPVRAGSPVFGSSPPRAERGCREEGGGKRLKMMGASARNVQRPCAAEESEDELSVGFVLPQIARRGKGGC